MATAHREYRIPAHHGKRGRPIGRRPHARAALGGAAGLALLFPILGLATPSPALTLREASPLEGTASAFHPYPFVRAVDAVSLVVNPAQLGTRPASEFYALVTHARALRNGDSAFLFKTRLLGFGYERYRPLEDAASVGRLTVGLARVIARGVSIGASYGWYFSEDDELADLSGLSFGLQLHSRSRLGLSGVAHGWNRPTFRGERIPRRYAAGFGLVPGPSWLLLFSEARVDSDQDLGESIVAYGLELEPIEGVIVRGRADTDGDFRFGLEWNFNQSGYGVVGLYEGGEGNEGRAGYIRLTDTLYRRGRGW
jgi:hypothetical protein